MKIKRAMQGELVLHAHGSQATFARGMGFKGSRSYKIMDGRSPMYLQRHFHLPLCPAARLAASLLLLYCEVGLETSATAAFVPNPSYASRLAEGCPDIHEVHQKLPKRRVRRCKIEEIKTTGMARARWDRRCGVSNLKMANPEGTQQMRDRDLELMFYDEAQVYVRAGSGGAGAATFKVMAKRQRGSANGGSGGKGGDVSLVCEGSLNTLVNLRGSLSFVAERGSPGEQRFTNGRDGASLEIPVPPGTVVRDKDNGNIVLGELREAGDRLMVAQGGEGGRGNAASRATRGQSPTASPPGAGKRRWLSLELRLVADVGLVSQSIRILCLGLQYSPSASVSLSQVGVPNAGKSTLLAAVSNAKPKIADYPFTTLVPNLGVCDPEAIGFKGAGMVLADIPGLLEGAHKGVGLGRAFLRHVERCRAIIHVVSGASPDPVGDFRAINQELALFSEALAMKPQVVVLNKIDLPEVQEKREQVEYALRQHMGHTRLMSISAGEGEHTTELMKRTRRFLDAVEAQEAQEEERQRLEALRKSVAMANGGLGRGGDRADVQEYEALEDMSRVLPIGEHSWAIRDARLAQMSLNTDWNYYDAMDRFLKVMESLGILEELREAGARDGDSVFVGNKEIALAEPPASR